jgi:hypothetical protein
LRSHASSWRGCKELFALLVKHLFLAPDTLKGGVSNVDIDENNPLYINTIGVAISTFETLPP